MGHRVNAAMSETTLPFDPDEKLHEAIASFEQARDGGQTPDPIEWMARYPELANRLRQYFGSRAMFGPFATPAPTGPEPFPEFAEYQILERIGSGGMGVVYRARQKKLNRLVAVKVIRSDRNAAQDEVLRFRREAEKLAELRHPNVVQVFDAGEERGCPFFAMELIEGGSLARKLEDGWLPTPNQAADLVRALAEGIQYAHISGIVHRDLKPANILLDDDGRGRRSHDIEGIDATPAHENLSLTPKITDFGLAKKLDDGESLTNTGVVVGTAKYMSPEQAQGDSKNVGPAADIYSLGAILYELLTGRPPFLGTSLVDTLERVRSHEPWPVRQLSPGVPRDLETICLKCLCKKPADRYRTAADLAQDLRCFSQNRPIQARAATLLERLGRTVGHTRLLEDFHAFSNAYLIAGLVFFTAYASVFLLARHEGPEWLIWTAIFSPYAMLFSIFRQHNGPENGMVGWVPDRQVWSIWIGQLLAVGSMWIAFRLSGRTLNDTIAIGIPVQASLTGVALFIMGCDYWGRYYLFGLIWLAAAAQMIFAPAWAPLEYAFLALLSSWSIAWEMRRLARNDLRTPASGAANPPSVSPSNHKN